MILVLRCFFLSCWFGSFGCWWLWLLGFFVCFCFVFIFIFSCFFLFCLGLGLFCFGFLFLWGFVDWLISWLAFAVLIRSVEIRVLWTKKGLYCLHFIGLLYPLTAPGLMSRGVMQYTFTKGENLSSLLPSLSAFPKTCFNRPKPPQITQQLRFLNLDKILMYLFVLLSP